MKYVTPKLIAVSGKVVKAGSYAAAGSGVQPVD